MAEETSRDSRSPISTGGDVRPIPDPTLLTTTLVEASKDELRREMQFRQDVLEARLDAYDKAIVLLQDRHDRIPAHVEEQIGHIHEVVNRRFDVAWEKFRTIDLQFAERDVRAEQGSGAAKEAVTIALQSGKEAVAAALQAAKEAVQAQNTASASAILKSETSTDKRIDEVLRLLNSTTSALETRITIITEQSKNTMTRQEVEQLFRTVMDKLDGPTGLSMRLENMVARTLGRDEREVRTTTSNQWLVGAVLGGAALLLTMITIVMKLH